MYFLYEYMLDEYGIVHFALIINANNDYDQEIMRGHNPINTKQNHLKQIITIDITVQNEFTYEMNPEYWVWEPEKPWHFDGNS